MDHNIVIHPSDNVCVNVHDGHKKALCAIHQGEAVVKYGCPIGLATQDIPPGAAVHTHNLQTSLGDLREYRYAPRMIPLAPQEPLTIQAYRRSNGHIGIRNDIWIINTVGCVNHTAARLSRETGALHFPHPYGCSQLGGDHAITQKILTGLVQHPNAGGILLLGLGCENNGIADMRALLGNVDEARIRYLNVQDCADEIAAGTAMIRDLQTAAATDHRVAVPISELKIGLKCGGSDAFSGISANALLGQVTNTLVAMGASAVLTEVPEMFGAETLLMERCINQEVFDKTVQLIQDYKRYFQRHGQPIYENPSPGNRAGGITTLEEKSLGCVQKGGQSPVVGVLDYGERVQQGGLHLLAGPGNDMVAITNLTAAGCHLILFTTGRGTPLGAPVPTVKISSNSALHQKKPHWIDFDAGPMLDGAALFDDLLQLLCRVAGGQETRNEQNDDRQIAIFKDGVTL